MPEIIVYMAEGRTLEQKRGLVRDVTEAVVKNTGAAADHVVVQIVESPRNNKSRGGVLFSERAAKP